MNENEKRLKNNYKFNLKLVLNETWLDVRECSTVQDT